MNLPLTQEKECTKKLLAGDEDEVSAMMAKEELATDIESKFY